MHPRDISQHQQNLSCRRSGTGQRAGALCRAYGWRFAPAWSAPRSQSSGAAKGGNLISSASWKNGSVPVKSITHPKNVQLGASQEHLRLRRAINKMQCNRPHRWSSALSGSALGLTPRTVTTGLRCAGKTAMARQHRQVQPNPSLKRSTNGRPPGPGRWYVVHFHRPGPGVQPSSPA